MSSCNGGKGGFGFLLAVFDPKQFGLKRGLVVGENVKLRLVKKAIGLLAARLGVLQIWPPSMSPEDVENMNASAALRIAPVERTGLRDLEKEAISESTRGEDLGLVKAEIFVTHKIRPAIKVPLRVVFWVA